MNITLVKGLNITSVKDLNMTSIKDLPLELVDLVLCGVRPVVVYDVVRCSNTFDKKYNGCVVRREVLTTYGSKKAALVCAIDIYMTRNDSFANPSLNPETRSWTLDNAAEMSWEAATGSIEGWEEGRGLFEHAITPAGAANLEVLRTLTVCQLDWFLFELFDIDKEGPCDTYEVVERKITYNYPVEYAGVPPEPHKLRWKPKVIFGWCDYRERMPQQIDA